VVGVSTHDELKAEPMRVIKAYKTELDPNNKQATFFGRCCGASRYVYNWGLAEWSERYDLGATPSATELKRYFNNQIKDELCPWLRALPYAVTEAAFVNLGLAFKNFFRRVKNGDKEVGYPKFKKRGRTSNSFQVCNLKVENDQVRITGVGWVRLKERGYIPTDAKKYGTYATISEKAGRWFVSVQVEEEIPDPQNGSVLTVGVDFGLKSLAVCSDGTVYENPRPLRHAQRRLKMLGKELARRTRGGSNWHKTKRRLQRQHAKVANIRKHVLHQISHDLIVNKHPAMVVIENLNVRGMVKNHHLSQAINDVGFYELRRQIEYKAQWNGVDVIVADRWFPSSKLCRFCGSINDGLTLADREWICDCGAELDRDLNAAMNLAAYGRNRETHGDCLGS